MTKPQDLPADHDWYSVRETDRLSIYCEDCDIWIPVTANDTQAGIRLFCPRCDDTMEYDYGWRE